MIWILYSKNYLSSFGTILYSLIIDDESYIRQDLHQNNCNCEWNIMFLPPNNLKGWRGNKNWKKNLNPLDQNLLSSVAKYYQNGPIGVVWTTSYCQIWWNTSSNGYFW